MVSFFLCPLKIYSIFTAKYILKKSKVATGTITLGGDKLIKGLIRTTLRIDNNLKTRIELIAIKNNLSFNKMLNYIIELGYNSYMEKFDKYYENQDDKLERDKKYYEETNN